MSIQLNIFHPSIALAVCARIKCPFARHALSQTCRAGRKYYYASHFNQMLKTLSSDIKVAIKACEALLCSPNTLSPIVLTATCGAFKFCPQVVWHEGDIPREFLLGEICRRFGCDGNHRFAPHRGVVGWVISIDCAQKTWYLL